MQTHGLEGSINDLTEMSVGAFSRADATMLLQELASFAPELQALPEEVIDSILDRVGWLLPYYLQLMFHCMMSIPDDERSEPFPTASDIETAYMRAIRTSNLGHWSSRLKDLLQPEEQRQAQRLLTVIAHADDGPTREQLHGMLVADSPNTSVDVLQNLLRKLLKLLADDGYLVEEHSAICFRSFLLRDYWRREFPK